MKQLHAIDAMITAPEPILPGLNKFLKVTMQSEGAFRSKLNSATAAISYISLLRNFTETLCTSCSLLMRAQATGYRDQLNAMFAVEK